MKHILVVLSLVVVAATFWLLRSLSQPPEPIRFRAAASETYRIVPGAGPLIEPGLPTGTVILPTVPAARPSTAGKWVAAPRLPD